MSQEPWTLALHLLLELAALAAMVVWAWTTRSRATRWAWAIGLPIVAGALWALFRAIGDGPAATVEIPGSARLALEWLILGGGAFLLWRTDRRPLAVLMLGLIVIDYALQYDRVARLVTA
jgi:hypothetical protein